jgi:hypothetical protein
MKIDRFRVLIGLLYLAGISLIVYVAWTGREYYGLSLIERPRAEMHALLKPGGRWGHMMGIVGSAMLLLLLLYSARKRRRFGLRGGRLSRWLDVHIWLGIMGPAFITLHSSFKFHGIVSVSYYSMLAVMLSGFVGRYIYIQIPRDEAGTALPLQEIDSRIEELGRRLGDRYGIAPEMLARVDERAWKPRSRGGPGALIEVLFADIMRPVRSSLLLRYVRRAHPELPRGVAREIVRLANRKALLRRRRELLRTMNTFLHYWHVIHKPFAYVMLIIMFVHIGVVVAMGEGVPL